MLLSHENVRVCSDTVHFSAAEACIATSSNLVDISIDSMKTYNVSQLLVQHCHKVQYVEPEQYAGA
jgi:saccharopine dehydrogenase-like NADP-dependent oxidoreductase